MAGEAYLTYGLGHSFSAKEVDRDLIEMMDYEPWFPKTLTVITPFHGSKEDLFAVVAKSTVRSGDPQEWDHGYGVQKLPSELTEAETESFALLFEELAQREELSKVLSTAPTFGLVISLTADY